MIRLYIRVTSVSALKMMADGFWDIHSDLGEEGVFCEDRPRHGFRAAAGQGLMICGPEGDTVLCVDVPDEVFHEREVCEGTRGLTEEEVAQFNKDGSFPEGLEMQHMGHALIPAAILNQYGRPRLYDHEYAGASRRELLQSIRRWELKEPSENDDAEQGRQRHIQEMRDAIVFFDKIGWLTPLRFTEEAPDDYAKPGPWFEIESIDPD
jgi:hypothetical protein